MNADPNARDKLLNLLSSTLSPASEPVTDTPPPPPVIPDHQLIRRVGRGSYGEVWLARSALGTWRAVKIVHRAAFDHDRPYEREFEGIRRFEPVSRTHPSQLNVLHIGRNDAARLFYYVMELADDANAATPRPVYSHPPPSDGVQGTEPALHSEFQTSRGYSPRTLRSDLHHRGRLPFEECLGIGLALATALDHLHRHGLVHRDIKPSNIIFVKAIPKLADIGLVAQAEATLSMVGTEGYLPPEGPGTAQADIFSLGKVLYEMATGRDRQEFPELPTNLIEQPDDERARLAELNEIIVRACHADLKQRYQTAAELHADLALLQSGKSVSRMRATERRLKFVARAGAIVTAIAVVIAAGWLWQVRQTHRVSELAVQKSALLEENQRQARAQEQQIIRALSASGVQRLEADDPSSALPWFVEALRRVENHSPKQASLHRLRLGNLLRYQPRLLSAIPISGAVRTLAFSANGRWLAAGSDAGLAQVIDTQGGVVAQTLTHSNGVNSVEFSPDSRRLLTGNRDGLARLWTLGLTNPPLVFPHKASVRYATFSPNGDLILTASADKTARVWRAADGQPVGPPLLHSQPLYHACFSPDGKRIATGTGEFHKSGELHLWNLETRAELAPASVLKDMATWTGFSPDGKRLASACGEAAYDFQLSRPGVLVDGQNGAFVSDLDHIDRITHVSFSPDGKRLAVATIGYEVLVVDASTGARLIPPLKHSRWVQRAVFSPDGRWIASVSSDGTARVWDAATGVPLTPPLLHPGEVYCVVFDPAGRRLATAGDGGLIFLWDIGHAEPDLPSIWYSRGETMGAISPDDHLAITYAPRRPDARTSSHFPGRGEEPVRVFELKSGRLLWTFAVPGGTSFVFPAISADGALLSLGSYNGNIRLWDLHTGQLRWEARGLQGVCEPRAFSHDGRLIAASTSGSNGEPKEVRFLASSNGELLPPLLIHPTHTSGMEFSPDDRVLATACRDGRIRLWDVSTGRLLRTVKVYDGEVDDIRFSRDGRRLLAAGKYDKTARLFATDSGAQVIPPLRHNGIVWDAMFDAEERRILTISHDLSAVQWDARTGERIDPPMLHQRGLNNGGYDGTGRIIGTSSADQTVRLWSADNGELLAAPFRHGAPAQGVALSKSGDRLVTSSADGRAQIWELAATDLPIEDLKLYAEAVSGQSLSTEGQRRTLSAAEIATRMTELRGRRPQDFILSSEQIEQWHRREKLEAEGTGNEFAARFHANRSSKRDSDGDAGRRP